MSNYNYSNLGKILKLFIPQSYLLEKKKPFLKYRFDEKNYEKIIDQTTDEISNFIDKTDLERLS